MPGRGASDVLGMSRFWLEGGGILVLMVDAWA